MEAKGLTPILNVSDIAGTFACVAAGLEVTFPPTDMPWNVREMHLCQSRLLGKLWRIWQRVSGTHNCRFQALTPIFPALPVGKFDGKPIWVRR
jgi:hypothetical protein